MSLALNGFRIELSSPIFKAYVLDMRDNKELKAFKHEHENNWFLYWQKGKLYGFPKKILELEQIPFSQICELNCIENLKLINRKITDILSEVFPKYSLFKQRPFTVLSQKNELISTISKKLDNPPGLLSAFTITPKLTIESKTVELRADEVFIGLFLKVSTCWEIKALLSNLQREGVDLEGLYVVHRTSEPGKRRLVGKISSFCNGLVHLSESYDGISSISEYEVWLEGSKKSFTRCLKIILGDRYGAFENERDEATGNLLDGVALEDAITKLGEYIKQKSPLQITPDLQGHIGDRIEAFNDSNYKSIIQASPVEFCFDAARTKRDIYPWRGICNYGTFSRDSFARKSPEIAVFFLDTVQGATENFLRNFKDGVSIKKQIPERYGTMEREESRYTGGFAKIFGLFNPKFTLYKIPWLKQSNLPPAIAYKEEIENVLRDIDKKPDAAIVVVLDEHSRLPDSINPYLQSKALLLMAGIPVQGVRESTLKQSQSSIQYTLQSFSVALYAKMKGIPWTVDHDLTISDELVIGIGTCELSDNRFLERQRFVGITTVFRGDGNYLLGDLSRECSYNEYPDVLRESTISILRQIKQRNGWQPGDTVRLVFHAARPLQKVQVSKIVKECVEEIGQEQKIEFAFLTISQAHPFFATDKSQPGIKPKYKSYQDGDAVKGKYAPARGTIVQLGRFTRLLSTNGSQQVKRITSPLPTPLLIHLDRQSTYNDLTYLSEQVLKFTSLSWRSVLPISKPVTIYYSELIAELLARLKSICGWSPALLDINLNASKWFL
jgi:hypothetical protein